MKKLGIMISNIKHTFNSIILCIRFPFLYPRNRWTGTHYYNFNIIDYYNEILKDSYHFDFASADKIIDKPIKYSWGKTVEWFHNNILQIIHCIPTYNELDALDTGWRKAFGIQLCKELRKELIKNHFLFQYRIIQIKEKWGELCWYDNAYYITKDIINKYINLSYKTCITCGKPAKYRTPVEIWECPYCEEHIPEHIAKKFLTEIK